MNVMEALRTLAPGAEWVTDGTSITEWLSPDIPQPTQEEIDAEIARLQYAVNRKEEYPTTDELIVALWEAVIEERMASSIDLQGKRTAIKEKYPK